MNRICRGINRVIASTTNECRTKRSSGFCAKSNTVITTTNREILELTYIIKCCINQGNGIVSKGKSIVTHTTFDRISSRKLSTSHINSVITAPRVNRKRVVADCRNGIATTST